MKTLICIKGAREYFHRHSLIPAISILKTSVIKTTDICVQSLSARTSLCTPDTTHNYRQTFRRCLLELETKLCKLQSFTITEKAPTRAYSWLKAPTRALLSHANQFLQCESDSRHFQPEGAVIGRGLLCDCETSNIVNVRFQL